MIADILGRAVVEVVSFALRGVVESAFELVVEAVRSARRDGAAPALEERRVLTSAAWIDLHGSYARWADARDLAEGESPLVFSGEMSGRTVRFATGLETMTAKEVRLDVSCDAVDGRAEGALGRNLATLLAPLLQEPGVVAIEPVDEGGRAWVRLSFEPAVPAERLATPLAMLLDALAASERASRSGSAYRD